MNVLLYFSKKQKSWIFSADGTINTIPEGACLHNVTLIVIPDAWEDIWKRIGLGVPTNEAKDPYPHAFLTSSCLLHVSQFGKKIADAKEIIYNFEKGIFTYNDGSDLKVMFAQTALITPDGKIFT
jgi:hypothetical protein